MNLESRKLLDRSFSAFSLLSIVFMAVALVVILGPIIRNGVGAYIFSATVEHRKSQLDLFEQGNPEMVRAEVSETDKFRAPLYASIQSFNKDLDKLYNSAPARASKLEGDFEEFKKGIRTLLGPAPGAPKELMARNMFGQSRWDKALETLHNLNNITTWIYADENGNPIEGQKVLKPRADLYAGTSLEPVFKEYLTEDYAVKMLQPRLTFFWRFFTESSEDAHFFGGIWPEVLGTIYLTFGAMLLAIPVGVFAAVYLVEYAGDTKMISFIRSCISTLAGVPSIVFGLFGLACFISEHSWFQISKTSSVAAGCATLALLILPTIIRASEEAIRSVPASYREASVGLGSTKWHTVATVILPAALPGILTGIVISMGRAAGETAPIIFTAAASMGAALSLDQVFTERTPALPWNIYNLCTEHEAVEAVRHVQFGMVFTLIGIVLLLNMSAIYLRARISKKLRG